MLHQQGEHATIGLGTTIFCQASGLDSSLLKVNLEPHPLFSPVLCLIGARSSEVRCGLSLSLLGIPGVYLHRPRGDSWAPRRLAASICHLTPAAQNRWRAKSIQDRLSQIKLRRKVGKCHAAAEWTFGTIYQRFLSGALARQCIRSSPVKHLVSCSHRKG